MDNNEKKVKNFNEVLKQQEAERLKKTARQGENEEMALDDAKRVKVLSPGRLVVKRFVRNKLAIIGLAILVFMFVFSFLCPVFYPYEQTEIFYKYENLNIEYASAVERTEYVNYSLNTGAEIHYSVANMINSHIGEMEAQGLERMTVADREGNEYEIVRKGDNVYTLDAIQAEPVCSYEGIETLGTYNSMIKLVSYKGSPLDSGFDAAVEDAVKSKAADFEYDGICYYLVPAGVKNTYNIIDTGSGSFAYDSAAMDSGFEAAVRGALIDGSFEYGGAMYSVSGDYESGYRVTSGGDSAPALVCSTYVFDAYDTTTAFSSDFKAGALMALYEDRAFSADGEDYTIKEEDGVNFILDASDGSEVAVLNTFAVRRYSGEDSLSLDFKAAVQETIEKMEQAGQTKGTMIYSLPHLDEKGDVVYEEDGTLKYADTELTVTMKVDTYVLTCFQVTHLIDIYASPSGGHFFGTDADGMDILSRMMYGGRISLMVGFVVVILETFIGVIMGGIAGYFSGWVDTIIMRIDEIFYCIPTLPILIILGAFFDSVKMNSYVRLIWMMVVLGILGWPGVARLVRGQILSLREQEFMTAAEATGLKVGRRIFRHLVPNVMPQLIVSATMGLGSVIIYESTLSFLGLGVKHPLATWGTMINSVTSSNENMIRYAYIWIPVGLLICLTVIAFNFVGDGLRDAFDPKMKR